MKHTLLALTAATLLLTSCQDAPKADKATTGEATTAAATTGATYNVDLAQSREEWTGTKPTGTHHGFISLKSGTVSAEGANITGGKFDIDITTLKVDDKEEKTVNMLGGHLKSADFFDVEKYPTATFEITAVKPGVDAAANPDLVMKDATHTVSGNLTMKGITKGITFPAKIAATDANITTDANFNIDRSEWGVDAASLKDKLISKTVNVGLHIVANK
jgi:polyisoprenoid-binding protein YceI